MNTLMLRAGSAARGIGIAALVLGALCIPAPARAADDAIAPHLGDRKAFDRFVAEGRDSPFGLDYVFVHNPGARNRELVDGVCGTIAFRWVNFADVNWGQIEKRPPRDGRHAYDWSDLDGAVGAWQRNGIHAMMSPEKIYVYECLRKDGRRVLVAFCDDHVAQNHDEPPATMRAAVPVEARRARVTHVITRIGQTRPDVVHKPVERGLVRLELTEYPVFIEAAEDGGP